MKNNIVTLIIAQSRYICLSIKLTAIEMNSLKKVTDKARGVKDIREEVLNNIR